MIINYLFAASKGDIPVSPREFETPFKVGPSEIHPFLTLGGYFEAIKRFLLEEQAASLVSLLGKCVSLGDISQLVIRSEKHGLLYHVASVELSTSHKQKKFAVSTAISEKGKEYLNREFEVINYLNDNGNLPYLPKVYFKDEVWCHRENRAGTLVMSLGEWFEGYHEFHLSYDEKDQKQRVCIWDQKKGHRFVSKLESHEIYKQSSKILTLYYDFQDFREIHPWHHAAGDFVISSKNGKVDVKLTTARRYQPVMTFAKDEKINSLAAIIYFFLNLTIQMRLDKLDGLGAVAWAEDFILPAVLEGFFSGLRAKDEIGGYALGKVGDLVILFKEFSRAELLRLLHSLMGLHSRRDPGDFEVIQSNLAGHARQLYAAIQSFDL
jgi:hypothetical protein